MSFQATAVAAPVGTGGPVPAAPAGVGCLGSGAPSTTYKPRGPKGWLIPNLDRSTVFYRPNQQFLRQTLPRSVELQPHPIGTVSGGEGQAGTGLVSSHRSRE